MHPGIIVQHADEVVRETSTVRSDILGVVAVVTKARWPKGGGPGDFLELRVESLGQFERNKGKRLFDAAAQRAVRSFFENGGQICHIFGVLIENEQDLLTVEPKLSIFSALMDRLRGEEDIGLLSMPCLAYLPLTYEGGLARVGGEGIWGMFLAHCNEMNNRFLIVDPPRDLHDQELKSWVGRFRKQYAKIAAFGAVYYPWLQQGDAEFPPSGAIAGVYARVENANRPFGVGVPPANEILRGISHPSVPLRFRETGDLSEHHINPIISQPARGVVVWGARTLSKEPNWIHINSRRIVSLICEQVRRDTEWAVFENQSPDLWSAITRIVRGRLDQIWGAGLLTGPAAGQEYLVKCDAETNPPDLREVGQVNVLVQLRPISTTEFILVELRLGDSGASGGI